MTGHDLREARQALRLSKTALARALGVSLRSVQTWELHGTPRARDRMIRLALAALGAVAARSSSTIPPAA